MTASFQAAGLTKTYRAGLGAATSSIHALRGLDIVAHEGELLGLLGPNGAGKSTFLLCAAGLLRPDAGRISWFGAEHWPLGRPPGVAYVPERSLYHRFLSVREALEFYATLHELPGRERAVRVQHALDRVGLGDHADKRISQLSRGMIQRLGIAQAIVGRPRLLLLDEALSGLDPLGARDVRDLLLSLRADGVTLIVSSHDLASIQHIASRIVVMNEGRARAELDPAALTGARWLVATVESPALAARLLRPRHPDARVEGRELHVPLGAATAEELIAECRTLGVDVLGARVRRDDLEQQFFDLIDPPARVAEQSP